MFSFLGKLLAELNTLEKKTTFIIALAGFVMSLISWIRVFWISRRRLVASIDEPDFRCSAFYSSNYLHLLISLLFINKSTNPLSIVAINLIGAEHYACNLRAGFVGTITSNIPAIDGHPPYIKYMESAEFPINLSGMQSSQQYIHFSLPKDFDYRLFTSVMIVTSKGRIVLEDVEQIARVRELLEKAYQDRAAAQETIQHNQEAQL